MSLSNFQGRFVTLALCLLITVAMVTATTQITIIAVPAGADLQVAINSAPNPSVLVLDARGKFVGNYFLKSGITLRSSRLSEIRAARVVFDDRALMPEIVTPNAAPPLTIPAYSRNISLEGIELYSESTAGYSYYLVDLENDNSSDPESQPANISIDRSLLYGPGNMQIQRAIDGNGRNVSLTRSHVENIKWEGVETHAFGAWNGEGPFLIEDNFLEAAGINIIFGGNAPTIDGLIPSDIRIVGNDLYKRPSWRQNSPEWDGSRWTVKNLLELKSACRATIDRNTMENSWAQAQIGWAIVFNAFHDAPWQVIDDVALTRNVIKNATNGINLRGRDTGDSTARMHRILVADNLLQNIGVYIVPGGQRGTVFQMLTGGEDITIDHNTVADSGSVAVALALSSPLSVAAAKFIRLRFTNNLLPFGLYGVFGDGCCFGIDAFNQYATDWTFAKNAFYEPQSWADARFANNYLPATFEAGSTLQGTDGFLVGVRNGLPTPTPTPPRCLKFNPKGKCVKWG